MTTPPGSPEPSGPPPLEIGLPGDTRRKHERTRKILKWTSISMATLLVLVVGGVAADYWYLNHRIKTVCSAQDEECQVPNYIEPSKAADAVKASNFVLIGSDTRAGKSGKGTGGSNIQGARSDTTIILHISANNSGATLISIPRDSYVQIPSCVINHTDAGKTLSSPEMNKFNAAFAIGSSINNKYGPACTEHTIETLTGLHIDHFAVIDFAGFQDMVNALGGVRMCVAQRLYDPIVQTADGYHGSGLDLPAGKDVEIKGDQALALMRARYNLDGGGDLPRIKRQQQFIGAMIRKATSTSLLIDPLKLQRFLKAATGALTTDGFGLGTMKSLAGALHNVGAGGVRLLTVPNSTSGVPYGDVGWDPTKAPALWNAIKHDKPIPGTKPKPTASPSPSTSGSPTPTPSGPPLSVPPSSIYVNVLNGTGQNNLAHTVATKLAKKGFHVLTVGDADATSYATSVVTWAPAKKQSSQTVAASIPGAVRQADPTAGSTITIILGANFTKVQKVTIGSLTSPTPTPSPSTSISSFSAAKKGCLS
ncbi:MAG: LCP family protein [Frankiaceae bacterium]|nr:LCP family protein [Frankiaceae bacterium]